jgi:hypothetical protein
MSPNVIPLLEFEGETLKFGSAEIRVIGSDSVIYAAPNLVFHYVRDHGYKPPQSFIDAVLAEPAPDSQEYQGRLRELGFLRQPVV